MDKTWTASINPESGHITIGADDDFPVIDGFRVDSLDVEIPVDDEGMATAIEALGDAGLTLVTPWTADPRTVYWTATVAEHADA